jgi:predicted GIY-YIG superfamily endonuclease
MTRFKHGKIYKLQSKHTNKFYIGSTTKTLKQRLQAHRSDYQRYNKDKKGNYQSSFEILKYMDCTIELLENAPCSTKAQLQQRKDGLIAKHELSVVNRSKLHQRKDASNYTYSTNLRNMPRTDVIHDKATQFIIDTQGSGKNTRTVTVTFSKPGTKRAKRRPESPRVACECGSIIRKKGLEKHLQTKSHKDMMDWFDSLQH